MPKLYMPFREVKFFPTESEEPGTFQGHLAYFDNIDYGEDLVEKGAFQKSIGEWKQKQRESGLPFLFPLTWNHDPDRVLGGFKDLWEDDEGLAIKAMLDLEIKDGAEKYSGLKKGYLRGLSIDYKPRKGGAVYERNVRRLKDINLIGGALVTHPMNPKAVVDARSIKMAEDGWEDPEQKAVSGRMDWPLAAYDRPWDSDAAERRLRRWAMNDEGELIQSRYRSVHFYYDTEDDPQNFKAYKLPFCDVIGGDVHAIPKAIIAVAGGHGVNAAKIPDEDKASIRRKVNRYYSRMREEFDDDSLVSPFEKEKQNMGAKEEKNEESPIENKKLLRIAYEQLQRKMHDPDLTRALLGMNTDTRTMIDVCNMDLTDNFRNSLMKMQIMNAFHCAMMKVLEAFQKSGRLQMADYDYTMESMMGPNMSPAMSPYSPMMRKEDMEGGGGYDEGSLERDTNEAIRALERYFLDLFGRPSGGGGLRNTTPRGENEFGGTQYGSRDLRDVLHKAKGEKEEETSIDVEKLLDELRASL